MANAILLDEETSTAYRGLYTSLDSHLIPEGYSPYLRNVDLTRKLGSMMKRRGIQAESVGPVDAFTKVTGLHEFRTSAGLVVIFASAGSTIYDATASGAWVSRHSGSMAGANVNFETFNDLCIAVSQTESTLKSSGGAFSVLGGSPPASARFIRKHKNRILIGRSSAGQSRGHWSGPGDPELWTTAGGAGFQDFNVSDGDPLTSLAVCGGIAAWFKRHSVHIMTGDGPPGDVFKFRQIAAADGCVYDRTVVEMGNMIVYLSDTGVYGISEAGVWADLSPNITGSPGVSDLTAAAKLIACAGRLGRMYVLCYDSNADGVNDSIIALDVENGTWAGPWDQATTLKGPKANVFHRYLDGSLISGASDIKNLRRHDSGEDDEGAVIESVIRFKGLDGGDFTGVKFPDEFWFECAPIAGKTVNVRTRTDGVQVNSQSVSIAPTQISGTDRNIAVRFANLPDVQNPRVVEFEIQNNELAAPVRITRYKAKVNEFESQKVPT